MSPVDVLTPATALQVRGVRLFEGFVAIRHIGGQRGEGLGEAGRQQG
jgi:hypothetical protein